MKTGDIVRWRKIAIPAHGGNPPWMLGVLVEYQSWEKIATVLSDGTLHRIPARDVEKYGRGGLR